MSATRSGSGGAAAADALATISFRALAAGAARVDLVTIAPVGSGGSTIDAGPRSACRDRQPLNDERRAWFFADRTADHARRPGRSRRRCRAARPDGAAAQPGARSLRSHCANCETPSTATRKRATRGESPDRWRTRVIRRRTAASGRRRRRSARPQTPEDLLSAPHPRDPLHRDSRVPAADPGPCAPTRALQTTRNRAKTSMMSIPDRLRWASTVCPTDNGEPA